MMRGLGIVQLTSISLGLLFGSWMLFQTAQDYFWANQPLIKAFYDHDVLRHPHDEDGLFHAQAFDALIGRPLLVVRAQLETVGLSCDPANPTQKSTSCTYGYETQTGCCRFRVVLGYDDQQIVRRARGDKTGRCPRQ